MGSAEALTESAHAASQSKDTYLAAQFWRLTGRRSKKRMRSPSGTPSLSPPDTSSTAGSPTTTWGGDWFLERYSNEAHIQRLIRQLHALGYNVALTKAA